MVDAAQRRGRAASISWGCQLACRNGVEPPEPSQRLQTRAARVMGRRTASREFGRWRELVLQVCRFVLPVAHMAVETAAIPGRSARSCRPQGCARHCRTRDGHELVSPARPSALPRMICRLRGARLRWLRGLQHLLVGGHERPKLLRDLVSIRVLHERITSSREQLPAARGLSAIAGRRCRPGPRPRPRCFLRHPR